MIESNHWDFWYSSAFRQSLEFFDKNAMTEHPRSPSNPFSSPLDPSSLLSSNRRQLRNVMYIVPVFPIEIVLSAP
ncbi:hypothetical protein VKT23_010639 [Stygiomarasmius scandens]|uniref:Uncharacterized protein n=1 Tax=Marasmiellus scandens TaxID=2682957 RepID=A0ABR1JBR8_9AGAR